MFDAQRIAVRRGTRTLFTPLAHLAPPSWRGPSRAAQWRRSRARKIASFLALAIAALFVVAAATPPPPQTVDVRVASRPIPAGTTLNPGDIHTVQWPIEIATPVDPTGRVTLSGLRAGEPITDGLLRAPLQLSTPVPDGFVVVSVPLAEASLAASVRPGDRVAAWSTTGTALGSGLDVVSVTPATEETAAVAMLAVSPGTAAQFAVAQGESSNGSAPVLIALDPSS